jgi:hypothetical protein
MKMIGGIILSIIISEGNALDCFSLVTFTHIIQHESFLQLLDLRRFQYLVQEEFTTILYLSIE